jgi:hypothetical protein
MMKCDYGADEIATDLHPALSSPSATPLRSGGYADKVKRADGAKYRNGVVTPKGILVRKPRWDVTAKGVVEVA